MLPSSWTPPRCRSGMRRSYHGRYASGRRLLPIKAVILMWRLHLNVRRRSGRRRRATTRRTASCEFERAHPNKVAGIAAKPHMIELATTNNFTRVETVQLSMNEGRVLEMKSCRHCLVTCQKAPASLLFASFVLALPNVIAHYEILAGVFSCARL